VKRREFFARIVGGLAVIPVLRHFVGSAKPVQFTGSSLRRTYVTVSRPEGVVLKSVTLQRRDKDGMWQTVRIDKPMTYNTEYSVCKIRALDG